MARVELLSGQTMTVAAVIFPRALSINLRLEGLSSATVTVDETVPDIACGAWVRVWCPDGSAMVCYVKSIQSDYRTGLRVIQLEHGFGLLQNAILYGEWRPANLGGTTQTVGIATAMATILSQQQGGIIWQPGTCEFSVAEGWSFTNATLYQAMEALTESVEDCRWSFDQSSLPWKVSLVHQTNDVSAEMRMSRNIDSLKMTVSTTDMATRVYPVGLKNLSIASVNGGSVYLQKNVAQYGVISKTVTDNSIRDAGLLKAWAAKLLDTYARPVVNVQLTGLDLSKATGESLDKLVLGRRCRIPLPRYGITVTERITELSYKDALLHPEQVSVTMATVRKTIQHVVASKASGGGGGKATTSSQCELKEQADKVEEVLTSKLWQDKDTIGIVGGAFTAVTEDGKTTLTLKQGARMYVNRDGAVVEVVDEGNVVSSINATKEEVKIQAKHINLSGYVTATQLEAVDAKFDNLTSGIAKANSLQSSYVYADRATIGILNSYAAGWVTITIDGTEYRLLCGVRTSS